MAEPLGPNEPRPGRFTDVAFLVVQLKTLEDPLVIALGCAVNVIEGFCGALDVTVTVIVDVAEPPGPVGVATKVVVTVGVTLVDPVGPKVPTPEIVTDVVFFEFQLSTDEEPLVMLEGWAVIAIDGSDRDA